MGQKAWSSIICHLFRIRCLLGTDSYMYESTPHPQLLNLWIFDVKYRYFILFILYAFYRIPYVSTQSDNTWHGVMFLLVLMSCLHIEVNSFIHLLKLPDGTQHSRIPVKVMWSDLQRHTYNSMWSISMGGNEWMLSNALRCRHTYNSWKLVEPDTELSPSPFDADFIKPIFSSWNPSLYLNPFMRKLANAVVPIRFCHILFSVPVTLISSC